MQNFQSHLHKLLFIALCGALFFAAPAIAQNNTQTGVAEGVLVGKGQGWIAVSVENQETGRAQTVRLSPVWVGGQPKLGGGPDKRMLALFEQLKKGDNLKFSWLRDGKQLYVTNLEVLPPQQESDNNEGAQE